MTYGTPGTRDPRGRTGTGGTAADPRRHGGVVRAAARSSPTVSAVRFTAAMELTQLTVNDLLARLGPEHTHLFLPGDLDPEALTGLLANRFGTPRTLALDGFTDPTAGDCGGAALLAPFGDRTVTMRAWAYGDQWFGTGTVRDAGGEVRPVLVVVRRDVPEVLALAPHEGDDLDWMERLKRITGWSGADERPDVDWAEIESRLGTALPGDYRRMVETFGAGSFDAFLDLNQEPWTHLRDDGLLIWAGTEHEDLYCWRTDDADPDRWTVVVRTFDGEDVPFGCRAAEFVCRALTDRSHPFTLARYFDTHWFMHHGRDD